MAQISDLVEIPEQKFHSDEEGFTAPSDTIFNVLSSLDKSGVGQDEGGQSVNSTVDNRVTNMADSSVEKAAANSVNVIPIEDDEQPPPLAKPGERAPPAHSAPAPTQSTPAKKQSAPAEADDFQNRLLEEPIDQEFNVGDFDVLSPKQGSAAKKKPRTSIGRSWNGQIDPRWLVPFEHGWKREIVQRGSMVASSKNCDTYYFPPRGKKLRSLPEIEKHLEATGDIYLTRENFTFGKHKIYKEPFEVFREAAVSRAFGKAATGETPSPTSGGTPRGRGRGRGRGGYSTPGSDHEMGASPSLRGRGSRGGIRGQGLKRQHSSSSEFSTGFDSSRVVDLTDDEASTSSKTPGKFVSSAAIPGQGGAGFRPMKKGPVAKKRTAPRHPHAANGSSVRDNWPPPDKRARPNSGLGPDVDAILCGLACPGREGLPPTLTCKTCMMLFHPACVNVDPISSPAKTFVCKSCKGRTGSTSMGGADTTTPKPNGDDVSAVELGKIINQNQVSGQLLTLPPGVLNHLDLTQPLALKVNNKVLMIPPNCFISSDQAVKVFLPPGTLPNTLFKEKNLPINFNFYAKNNEQILNFTEPGDSPVTRDHGPDDKENVSDNAANRLSRKQVTKAAATPNECHFIKLHSGYDCMINIFRYLSIADLLRAARVCRTWAKVSTQDCLWKVVKLKGSRVSDWEQAARRFKNHNTWFLDLRGMHLMEDRNRTWHQFTGIIDNLSQLRHITFGQSPACILHAVVEKLDKLEVLSAESITDMLPESQMLTTNTKIDIGKFANLKSLEQLKLRGLCGLTLPAFSFSGGLAELTALTNLKTLILTTLRNIPDSEFLFLSSLTNLEVLEIGDCLKWTDEVYKQLSELKKLKSLRLECGGETVEPALVEALKDLKDLQKLELFKFTIDTNLGDALKELPKLESLSIWPDDTSQVAANHTNTLNVFKSLDSIKNIGWGVIEGSEAVVLQSEDDTDDNMVECIAFLDEEAEVPEGGKRPVKFVSIDKMVHQLSSALPDATVKVLRTPAFPPNIPTSST